MSRPDLSAARRWRAAIVSVALAGVGGPALAADGLPARRPGLWELTLQTTQAPSRSVRQCIDARTDSQMQRFGQGIDARQCTRSVFQKEGNRYVGEASCRFDRTLATTRSVFAGDFQKAYRGEIEARYDPPMAGVAQSRMLISARWIGPCPSGWKPGDMEMAGMGRMNVNELQAGRAAKGQ